MKLQCYYLSIVDNKRCCKNKPTIFIDYYNSVYCYCSYHLIHFAAEVKFISETEYKLRKILQ